RASSMVRSDGSTEILHGVRGQPDALLLEPCHSLAFLLGLDDQRLGLGRIGCETDFRKLAFEVHCSQRNLLQRTSDVDVVNVGGEGERRVSRLHALNTS